MGHQIEGHSAMSLLTPDDYMQERSGFTVHVPWVTMGFHHAPRPEDWPIMPVARHSFEIRPVGFFSRNPAIDPPKP